MGGAGRTRRREETILGNPAEGKAGRRGSGSGATRVGGPRGSWDPGTHLSGEQVEELGGEGDQAVGAGVVEAAGRGGVRGRGTRGSPLQPGGQQNHAGRQHRGQHVEKQQEAQQREVGLGAGAKLSCRGQQRGRGLRSRSGPARLPRTRGSSPASLRPGGPGPQPRHPQTQWSSPASLRPGSPVLPQVASLAASPVPPILFSVHAQGCRERRPSRTFSLDLRISRVHWAPVDPAPWATRSLASLCLGGKQSQRQKSRGLAAPDGNHQQGEATQWLQEEVVYCVFLTGDTP